MFKSVGFVDFFRQGDGKTDFLLRWTAQRGSKVLLCVRTAWGMFILTPHWCSHCCVQIEQWRWDTIDLRDVSEASHPRAPWGQSPVLIWPARKTAVPHSLTVRWSHPNTQGGRRLVEMRNVKEGGEGWREATFGEGRCSSGSLILPINSDEIAKLGSCRNWRLMTLS